MDLQTFFGLSYNPYLVVPRSLLESMPDEWQRKMAELLEEMIETKPGKVFAEHHYFVQRTCPERDNEIHDAELHNVTHDDEAEVPPIVVLDDPFQDYRHPSRAIFVPPTRSPQ